MNKASKAQSFEEHLKKMTEENIEHRCKQWASYYFEKEFLPGLVEEIKKRVQVHVVELASSRKISVQVSLDGKPVM